MNDQKYSVVMILEDSESDYGYQILENCDSYDEADRKHDKYSNQYPHAWIEVIPTPFNTLF